MAANFAKYPSADLRMPKASTGSATERLYQQQWSIKYLNLTTNHFFFIYLLSKHHEIQMLNHILFKAEKTSDFEKKNCKEKAL